MMDILAPELSMLLQEVPFVRFAQFIMLYSWPADCASQDTYSIALDTAKKATLIIPGELGLKKAPKFPVNIPSSLLRVGLEGLGGLIE
jgi:hypothetical protein